MDKIYLNTSYVTVNHKQIKKSNLNFLYLNTSYVTVNLDILIY